MIKRELSSILTFYAVSPIHAGSGASVATVDLPIQRERHTGYPHIQASGVKGSLRDHFRKFNETNDEKLINFIFGSDTQDGWSKYDDSQPGAISVSDAKLLFFPMRSNVAPFVWVTCPTVMNRLKRDLEYAGISMEETFEVKDDGAQVLKGDFKGVAKIVLEDALVVVSKEEPIEVDFINNNFSEVDKLLLISDKMFDYCVSSCTEIQTNIKIDSKTGTAEDGSLRYQEFLPADSILYSIIYYSASSQELQAVNIKNYLQTTINSFLQIGGDVTLGKGVCKIKWIDGGK
ncbi:type III-B CRISPR module RAMP protein Cmr4 [Deferribacterales bacterium Es71-Z0220]|uniref:type III-B CRISPR module RAMP protein Cmr4 n=1 Tax=Deferrivibrio essentukiensis TaxID=2880922 RepID=UPI001F6064E9|nr:type III-B CRISPR module RAMP protein Cmr4 [Deferrivibrio essentukiensis]MCB4205241.1 type III-B CRISPR module RAMP protein Cmr4 [Deferrivibrio essentukiensis]